MMSVSLTTGSIHKLSCNILKCRVSVAEYKPERFLVHATHPSLKTSFCSRSTLEWRRQTRPETITWKDVEKAGQYGRIEIAAETDRSGRPIIFYQLKWVPSERTFKQKVLSMHCLFSAYMDPPHFSSSAAMQAPHDSMQCGRTDELLDIQSGNGMQDGR